MGVANSQYKSIKVQYKSKIGSDADLIYVKIYKMNFCVSSVLKINAFTYMRALEKPLELECG